MARRGPRDTAVAGLVCRSYLFCPTLVSTVSWSDVSCGLAIVVWWMFFSRAPWVERLGALVLMVIAPIGTKFIVHKSIAGGGMGMLISHLSRPHA